MVRPKDTPWGTSYLGRDEATWGKNGTGDVPIDPDVCPAPGVCPYYRDTEYDANNDKIHLIIASFRDRLCPRTLYNIFSRAKNPHRIFVRVLQQMQPDSDLIDDADCWDMACQTYNTEDHKLLDGSTVFNCQDFAKNVEMVTIDSGLAKGPCDARSKLSALIEHDYRHATDGSHRLEPVNVRDYCMQTDSHMDFSDAFDVQLIEMFHRAENDRAVLSTYVASMTQNNKDPKEVPNLCMITFTSTWRNWGTKLLRHAKKPKLTNLVWGAGMSFHKCHAELNVPYDPYLDNVFDGEETSRGIRFFTNGYDVYTPDKVLVTHDYEGHQSNPIIHTWGRNKKAGGAQENIDQDRKEKFDKVDWSYLDHLEKMKDAVEPKSAKRVNILMGVTDPHNPNALEDVETVERIRESRFGLGHFRTLEQAYEFTAFDPVEHKMRENKCGNLKWVPFEDNDQFNEKNDWGVNINLQRRIWNETQPLLPPPSGLSKSNILAAVGAGAAANKGFSGAAGAAAAVGAAQHPYTNHNSSLHIMGWVGIFILLLGGYAQRTGLIPKPQKSQKSLQ